MAINHDYMRLLMVVTIPFLIALAGCNRATPTPEMVTITFAYPEVDAAYYEPLVEEFNQNYPYITVELHPKSWDDLDNLTAPDADVFVMTDYALIALQRQGDIQNLDPLIEQDEAFDLADFYPATVNALTHDGKIWAIPAGVDMEVMYYNQDLFDQYKVAYPQMDWTWNDFLDAALAIRDPDAGVFGYTTMPGHPDATLFVYQHGGQIVDDLYQPTQTTFDDPLTIEALDWYADLFHDYNVAPTPEQAGKAFGGGQQFAFDYGVYQNKIGMWIGSLSERGGLTWPVKWEMNWKMVPVPRDAHIASQAWLEGYALSRQSQAVEEAWHWIQFLSKQPTSRLMPPRRSLAESEVYEQRVGAEVAAVARLSMENAVLAPLWPWLELSEAINIYIEALNKIVSGELTAQEAMDQAQREAEKISPQ